MDTRRVKLLLEERDGRDRAALADLERGDAPYVLHGGFERLKVGVVEVCEPPGCRVGDGYLCVSSAFTVTVGET